MVFIRTKRIKNNEYAYLVENRYRKRGNSVKQKNKKYLGRVIHVKRTSNSHFFDWLKRDPKEYMDTTCEARILDDLVRWELFCHSYELKNKGVLKLNHGFFCDYTKTEVIKIMNKIKRESSYNKESYEMDYAVELADDFVKAGLAIPESVFIALFKKLIGYEKQ